MCFQHRWEAQRFLQERLEHFGLSLYPGKTRLLEFGRFADHNRRRRGQRRPETFDFLGFTHHCRKDGKGRFGIGRQPTRKRMTRFLKRGEGTVGPMNAQGCARDGSLAGPGAQWVAELLCRSDELSFPTAMLPRPALDMAQSATVMIPEGSNVVGAHRPVSHEVLAEAEYPSPIAGRTICRHAPWRNRRG